RRKSALPSYVSIGCRRWACEPKMTSAPASIIRCPSSTWYSRGWGSSSTPQWIMTITRSAFAAASRIAPSAREKSCPTDVPISSPLATCESGSVTSPTPTSPIVHPLTWTYAGASASSCDAPAPIGTMPARRRFSIESSRPSGPWSKPWLFARFATSTPASLASSPAPGPQRDTKRLQAGWRPAPEDPGEPAPRPAVAVRGQRGDVGRIQAHVAGAVDQQLALGGPGALGAGLVVGASDQVGEPADRDPEGDQEQTERDTRAAAVPWGHGFEPLTSRERGRGSVGRPRRSRPTALRGSRTAPRRAGTPRTPPRSGSRSDRPRSRAGTPRRAGARSRTWDSSRRWWRRRARALRPS